MIYKDMQLEEYKGRSSPHFKNLVGKTFGNWKVLCRAPSQKCSTMFWCECSCGEVKKVFSTHLIRGFTLKCINCSANENGQSRKELYGEIPLSFWKEFKKRATGEKSRESRRNLIFNVTIEYVWNLYLKQNRKCSLSGLDIGFCTECILDKNKNKHKWIHTASLDRIDNTKGYEEGNVQWVHKDINIMKNVFNQEYFIQICKLIGNKSK